MEAGYNPFSEPGLPAPHPLTMSSSSSGIADKNFCLTANVDPLFWLLANIILLFWLLTDVIPLSELASDSEGVSLGMATQPTNWGRRKGPNGHIGGTLLSKDIHLRWG